MKKQKHNKILQKSFGFSLLELAVVLGIIGIIGSGLGVMYTEQKSLEESKTDQAKLIVVKKALAKFVKDNNYMPCPDTSNNGLENRVAANGNLPPINAVAAQDVIARNNFAPTLPAVQRQLGQAQINGVPVDVCVNDNGGVPFEQLNLTRALVEDIEGNPFIYAVDLGVTQPNNMLNCPADSACFFNSNPEPDLTPYGANLIMPFDSLPAFDATTLPVNNALGANNLRICTDGACGQVLQNGLLAVLIATGPSDHPISADENENLDNDANFVKRSVTKAGDQFNDLILGIAANEVRTRRIPTSAEVVIDPIDNTRARNLGGNDNIGGDGQTEGTDGTNIGTDAGTYEISTQTFDFGADAAGKTVALTFDTHAVGAWDKAATTRAGVFDDRGAVYARSTVDNSDQTKLKEFDYDHLADAWSVDDLEQVTFTSAINGRYSDVYNADGSWDNRVFTRGQQITTWQPTWDESHEYFVTLDETGKVNLDFEVETTATVETIEFNNIQLGLFDTPPDPPDFPIVKGIADIPQTQELNNDKSIRFDDGEGEESGSPETGADP